MTRDQHASVIPQERDVSRRFPRREPNVLHAHRVNDRDLGL
jgi:hypothetical protein